MGKHDYGAIDNTDDHQGLGIAKSFLWFSFACSFSFVPFLLTPFTIGLWIQEQDALMIYALELAGLMLALSAIFLLVFATMTDSFPLKALIVALFVDVLSSILLIGIITEGIFAGIVAMNLIPLGAISIFSIRVLGNIYAILELMKNHLSLETDHLSPQTSQSIAIFSKVILWIFSIDCLLIAPAFMFSSSLQVWFPEKELTNATLYAFQFVGIMFVIFGGFLIGFAAMFKSMPPRATKIAFLLDAILCVVWMISDMYWLYKDMMNVNAIVVSVYGFISLRIILDLFVMVKFAKNAV